MKHTTLLLLFILFGVACHQSQIAKFKEIDDKLNKLAKQLGTKLETTGGGASVDGVDVPKKSTRYAELFG